VATDTSTATADLPAGAGGEPQPESRSRIDRLICRLGFAGEQDFVLRVVQPALVGLIDGTVSSLAPIFAAAVASNSHTALLVGISTALGAGVSMGWSEALSDTGEQTGRGSAIVRGAITGGMTALGGMFHTLPFLISDVHRALVVAGIVVAIELFVIAWIRNRFLDVSLRSSLLVVTVGGAIVLGIGVGVGSS
jgi:erythrin-vacuolar iron transport family protein